MPRTCYYIAFESVQSRKAKIKLRDVMPFRRRSSLAESVFVLCTCKFFSTYFDLEFPPKNIATVIQNNRTFSLVFITYRVGFS